jgi:prolyl 4-hydroxylase
MKRTTNKGAAMNQTITPELRQWITEQVTAGHGPEAVLRSMTASGWQEDVALQALEQTLETFLKERGVDPEAIYERGTAALYDKPVPTPSLHGDPTVIDLGDAQVQVVFSLEQPRVVVFANVLSHQECDELMALAATRLERSLTVKTDTGTSEVNAARTSDGMFFQRGEFPLCDRIEQRIARLLNWPVENGEGLQVLRYRPGAEYKPHYDYFDPAQPGTPSILKRGGQRVGTLVMYLNTPEGGGATTFPDVKLSVNPVKGSAVFFSYALPHPSTQTLHGGAPVLAGEKWVATKWLREGRFE